MHGDIVGWVYHDKEDKDSNDNEKDHDKEDKEEDKDHDKEEEGGNLGSSQLPLPTIVGKVARPKNNSCKFLKIFQSYHRTGSFI